MRHVHASPLAVRVGLLLTTVLFGALLFAAPALAQNESAAGTSDLIRAALVAVGYYLSNSPWLAGNGGFFGLYRPLVAGFVVGVIFGDPVKGAEIGAAINILYLGFISAGGSIPADPSVAGWVGTALALGGGLDAQAAIALGVAVGLLGTLIFFTRMSVDAVFAHWADARAEAGDADGVARMNWLPPQIFLFVISFIPAFLAVYFGSDAVKSLIDGLQTNAPWVLRGFEIAGGLLPAIGIALNMRFIFRGTVWPYFFIGFIMAAASNGGLNIVTIGVVGIALAALHVFLIGDRAERAMQPRGA
ncbi:MAG TPA: PTS sugar transporter subunit IIC [Patescibacteria group bacterium]|jgi:mannose/fructose/N-acetylgalactosamine-specific phosphotransferase system component IIC|nr:PTS sugar transporter subunit IIC [Patescibacteria group bacterium]